MSASEALDRPEETLAFPRHPIVYLLPSRTWVFVPAVSDGGAGRDAGSIPMKNPFFFLFSARLQTSEGLCTQQTPGD